jgi:hypothetical protein
MVSYLQACTQLQAMKLFTGIFTQKTPSLQIVETHIENVAGFHPHTWVLVTVNSELCIAIKRCTTCDAAPDTIEDSMRIGNGVYCTPIRLDPAKLYPEFQPSYHRFRWRKGEDHKAVYKKHRAPLLLASETLGLHDLARDFVSLLTEREIRTCELMRDNPHANIAKYRGVQCKDVLEYSHGGKSVQIKLDTVRVIKLVFKRYDCNLFELIRSQPAVVDVHYCLESIAAGIVHMHDLGMVHSDIKPENIFVDVETSQSSSHSHKFVIGDFDSAAPTGSTAELKGGDKRWARQKNHDVVEEEDDWYAFQNLKRWLAKATGGKLENYRGIGKESVSFGAGHD